MNDLDVYIQELKKLYARDKDGAINLAKASVERLSYLTKENKSLFSDEKSKAIFINIILSIILLLVGIIYPNGGLYYAGSVFFLAGFFIGLFLRGIGIVFLCSHGLTGLWLMIGMPISNLIKSPLMDDNPKNLLIFLIAGVIFIIIAIISTIMHNLSKEIRKKKNSSIIPLLLFIIGIIILLVTCKYSTNIYKLNIF